MRQVLSRDVKRRWLEIYAVERKDRNGCKYMEWLSISPQRFRKKLVPPRKAFRNIFSSRCPRVLNLVMGTIWIHSWLQQLCSEGWFWHLGVEARDAVKQYADQAPKAKNYPTLNVNSSERLRNRALHLGFFKVRTRGVAEERVLTHPPTQAVQDGTDHWTTWSSSWDDLTPNSRYRLWGIN